jgi:hypothetical protein
VSLHRCPSRDGRAKTGHTLTCFCTRLLGSHPPTSVTCHPVLTIGSHTGLNGPPSAATTGQGPDAQTPQRVSKRNHRSNPNKVIEVPDDQAMCPSACSIAESGRRVCILWQNWLLALSFVPYLYLGSASSPRGVYARSPNLARESHVATVCHAHKTAGARSRDGFTATE